MIKARIEWSRDLVASRTPEAELVRLLCRSALTSRMDQRAAAQADRADWAAVTELTRRNRLWAAVQEGLANCGLGLPQSARAPFTSAGRLTMMMNSLALTTLRRVIPALQRKDVAVAVMKGPLQQRRIHGTYFARLSTDVDLLVRTRDFEHASKCLDELGYDLPEKFRTVWWRRVLGEQHFVGRENGLSVIDLHWRVQQPGCPAPAVLDEFVEGSTDIPVGSTQIPILSRTHAALLSCMSLAKAYLHREPGGAYALDVIADLATLDSDETETLFTTARRLRLVNTLTLAIEAAETTFGVGLQLARPASGSSMAGSANLSDMLLQPELEQLPWPRRGAYLWRLSDGGGALGKGLVFGRERVRSVSGDVCRRVLLGWGRVAR